MRCVQAPLGRRLRGPTCPGHFSRVPLLLHQRKRPHTSSLPKKIVPQYLRFASNQAVPSGKGTWAPSTSRSSVAVVYGWLGASEKNLAKYGALYAEKGFSVHIARSPVLDILNPQRAAALAKDASEQALDLWVRAHRTRTAAPAPLLVFRAI